MIAIRKTVRKHSFLCGAILRRKISLKKIGYVVLICLCAYFSEFTIPNQQTIQKIIWSGFALIGIFILVKNGKKSIVTGRARKYVYYASLPIVCMFLYTLLARLVLGDNLGILLQSFSTCAFMIVDILMALALVYTYKDKCIDFIYYLNVVSYTFTLVKMVYENGLNTVYHNFLDPGAMLNSYIERNDVGTAVVLLLIYYIWQIATNKRYKTLKYKTRVLVLFVIFVLCSKRSAGTGIVAGVFFALYFERKKLSAKRCFLLSSLVLISLLAFISVIRFGVLERLAARFGIDSAGRVYVWSTFSDSYSISPFYLGKGFQYLHKYMLFESTDGMVKGFGYLHNSLLQLYIELGFVLFFTYFFYQTYYMTNRTNKCFGSKTALLYMALYFATIAIYATDNVLTYPIYQVTLYTCIFCNGREEIERRVFINVGSNYIKL